MLDVPTALGRIFDRTFVSRQFLQCVERLIQRYPPASGAIKNASGTLLGGSRASQHIRPHRVINISEVAASLSIAKDRWLLALQHLHAEFREHARIRRRRILTGPKNIEVAQTHCFEPITSEIRRA